MELRLFYNGIDFVIAPDVTVARSIVMKDMYSYEEPYEDLDEFQKEEVDCDGWEEWPGEKEFTLHDDDGEAVKMTASEWVEQMGQGYFASSEW